MEPTDDVTASWIKAALTGCLGVIAWFLSKLHGRFERAEERIRVLEVKVPALATADDVESVRVELAKKVDNLQDAMAAQHSQLLGAILNKPQGPHP